MEKTAKRDEIKTKLGMKERKLKMCKYLCFKVFEKLSHKIYCPLYKISKSLECQSKALVSHLTKNASITEQKFRVYKKRWLTLFLFCIYTIINFIHLNEYSVIANDLVTFYSVSYPIVDSTAMAFMFLCIPFCLPGNYILDKLGLRVSILTGSIIVCISSWIKVASVHSNRFWVLVLGQSLIAISQVLVLPIPTKLAAVWFGANEVSLACSIGIAAMQVGIAIGFVVPPLIVKPRPLEDIHRGLQNLSYAIAIPVTAVVPILYFLLDDCPPSHPSNAQFQIKENVEVQVTYKKSLMNLMTSKSFTLLLITFGVNVGFSNMLAVLLNQIVLYYHPNAFVDVGVIGLFMMVSSTVGCLLTGYLIGRFGKLKEFIKISVSITLLAATMFFFLLSRKLIVVHINAILVSFFNGCIISVGYDLAAELTYPEPVGASIGILTISYQLFSIVLTYLYSFLFYSFSILTANLVILFLMLLSDILLCFIEYNFKRSAANAIS